MNKIYFRLAIAILLWTILGIFAFALDGVLTRISRDPSQVRVFRKANPCPLTGLTTGPCEKDGKRMVVDHMVPLCAGGPDSPENMAWQEYKASLAKDNLERELCKRINTCKQW